jgi:outer membrane biosynthesis protein TonB
MPSRFGDASPSVMRPEKSNRMLATTAALVVCLLALLSTGCFGRKTHVATPVATAPAAKPVTETKETPPATPPPAVKTPQSATVQLPDSGSPTAEPPKPPAPPHKQTAENTAPPKPPAPQIAPQLSPDDQAAYERKTNENITTAEKNLQSASGRNLNPTQNDLVEKIRGFLAQSREAMTASDWTRADNLSQKAYLLSVELINSL